MPEIQKNGANLVAFCPQRPEFLKQMREKNGLSFDILQDKENQYSEKLGLRFTLPDYLQEIYQNFKIDLPRINGEPSWTLAMPARYVVNQDGMITAADFDPDYTRRPEPEKILQDLKKIV
jgi:peroxiredoxin